MPFPLPAIKTKLNIVSTRECKQYQHSITVTFIESNQHICKQQFSDYVKMKPLLQKKKKKNH
jgi:hypothetical protein